MKSDITVAIPPHLHQQQQQPDDYNNIYHSTQKHQQQQQFVLPQQVVVSFPNIENPQQQKHDATRKNLKNAKKLKKDLKQQQLHHHEEEEELVTTTTTTTAFTNRKGVKKSSSESSVVVPPLDLQQLKKIQLAPIITNLKNSHHHHYHSEGTLIMSNSSDKILKEEATSPILVVETSKTNLVNNNLLNNPTMMLRQTLTNNIDQTSVVRSGSVSSGLDNEDDPNNMNDQQFESPVSTPRMFSPSSSLNFGDVMSPRESPHFPQPPPSQQLKQPNNISPPILVQPEIVHNIISEHETAVDLSSIETHETHDSEHTNVHSSKTSTTHNSSPALVEVGGHEDKRHSTRSRSNSAKSAQFNRPLERAHTAPNIITKKQAEKLHSKTNSRLSNKYGQSEYKTYVKHTLKLKEVGDMRVRGISLKYETNYHEFLEEAIPHKTFVTEMNHLNQFLKSNEPGTKYCCLGFTFFCCTLGLSMLPFAYQLSHFETAVRKYLDELNKKYASARVSWKLVPSTTPSDDSYIIVSLEKEIDSKDLEKLEIS